MRRVYDENIIVQIPENAHTCSDHRVYVVEEKKYFPDLKYNMDTRIWIGKAINETQMYPSDAYKERYRDELAKVTHLNLPAYHKNIGLYASVLSISQRTGLYDDLVKYLGPENANLVMDFAMYSMVFKSNAVKNFEGEMSRRMLFLGHTYSDSWIDDKIQNSITDDQVTAFKNAWVSRFKSDSMQKVWICVDGSNNDCNSDIPEAEKGKAKSRKNTNIISFLYAVTQDGTPITSQVYRGSRVDSKALIWMINHLHDYGIQARGVILDRGFCDLSSINLLHDHSYEYVIKLKENTYGFQQLLKEYRDSIKFNWKCALGHGLYGVKQNVQVFKTNELKADCVLIWDAKNGGMRTDYLVDELLEVIANAEAAIKEGQEPSIPQKYSQYVQSISQLKEDGTLTYKLSVQDDLIQSEMLEKGFNGLILSEDKTPGEANAVYNLRDSSEKQYAILKSQLGGDTFRAHSMHNINVREMISFVAVILRNEMLKICRAAKPRLDVNKTIQELDFIMMDRMSSGNYEITPQQSAKQNTILGLFDITDNNLRYIARYESKRCRGEMVSPIQALADPDEDAATGKTKTVAGIPKGSKAKGKGSKGKRAGSETQADALSIKAEKHRGPGRPKGSKNKPKNPDAPVQPKRKPGRPKGSKNKPK